MVVDFFGAVVNGVEFADFVGVADAFEELLDFVAGAGHLEVVLGDAHLGEGGGEQQVDGLRLVPVVVEVSDRTLFLEGDVSADGRSAKHTRFILFFTNYIPTAYFDTLA